MKNISSVWSRGLSARLGGKDQRPLAGLAVLFGSLPGGWRRLLASERLPGRVRTACLLLLIVLLTQVSARLTWALFTSPPTVPAETAGASLRPDSAGDRPGSSLAEAAARGEKLAGLHLFGRAQPQASIEAAALIEAPETTLSLVLKGLVATASGEGGLAVIAEKGSRGGKDGVYGIGEEVPGKATIEAIFADRVILRRAGKLETLYLESQEGKTASASRPAAVAAPVSRQDPGQRQLSRRYVEQTLANLPELARQVEVHIHNPEGGQHGFRLVSREGSDFLNNVGLQPGDILYEVNGIPLTDAGAAMTAFEQLRNARDIQLVFERDGVRQQTSVAIR